MDTKAKIRNFIKSNLIAFEDDLPIQDDDNIFESGFLDSSAAMQLVLFVEEAFNVQVTDDDLDLINFSTIDRIAMFIQGKDSIEY